MLRATFRQPFTRRWMPLTAVETQVTLVRDLPFELRAGAGYSTVDATVARKCGGRRACVVCSKAKAILSKPGSLQARPKNDKPTGSSEPKPMGTVILG